MKTETIVALRDIRRKMDIEKLNQRWTMEKKRLNLY
jgi:hypothetical protein